MRHCVEGVFPHEATSDTDGLDQSDGLSDFLIRVDQLRSVRVQRQDSTLRGHKVASGVRRPRGAALEIALTVAAVVTACGLLLLPGVRTAFKDATVAPLPGHVPGAVDWLVAVVNAIRLVSPFVAVVGVISFVGLLVAGSRTERGRMLASMATTEFSGVDHLEGGERRRPRWFRAVVGFVQGTGLAVLAIVLVGGTSGIEDEVTNGPLRPVEALEDLISPQGPTTYVFQSRAVTFMDDSALPAPGVDQFVSISTAPVVPFGKHLFNLDGRSSLQISVPQDVYERLVGRREASECAQRTVVVDDTVRAEVGDVVELNGVDLRVAAVRAGIAQMNRSVAILSDATVRDCILAGTSTAYFGAIVADDDLDRIEKGLASAGLSARAISGTQFRELNRDFWRANATPLLLQLILYIALFSGFAAAGERQSILQRNAREIGMLNAMGVSFATLRAIERRRALHTTMRATLIAAPLMVPVAAAFNASELGVQISVGLTEVTVGFSLTLVAMLLASGRALSQFRRSLDLGLAVKG